MCEQKVGGTQKNWAKQVRKICRWGIKDVIGSREIKTGTVEEGKQVVHSGIKDQWWKKKSFKMGAEDAGG